MVSKLEHRRALALAATRRLADKSGIEAAFAAGSLLDGLGNNTSDVDVYLVGSDLPGGRRQLFVDTIRIDVHELRWAELEDAIAAVASARMRSSDGGWTTDRHVTIALHLMRGELVFGAETIQKLRATLAHHPGRLRRVMLTRWLTGAHYELEDLAGLLDDNDEVDAAVMVCRRLLAIAGKAVAAACDDLYPGDKWLWRQLARSAPPEFPYAEFAHLLRSDPVDANGRTALANRQTFAETCLAAAATLGWHGVPLGLWPQWLPGTGPLRRRGSSIRAYDDAVILTVDARRRVRLRHDVALVWALCNGTGEQELARQAERLSDADAAYAGLSRRARTAEVLELLCRAGLVTRTEAA